MARPLRLEFPGALYHVTSRGNQGMEVFGDDDDRLAFLRTLQATACRFNWICHSYCLMGNHYHLVIETPDGNLSKGMRQVNGVHTQYVNRRRKNGGHLFQGRYKAILVEKESHLLEVIRYVVLNPVRARITSLPEEWPWSSFRGTCGLDAPHPCLTAGWVLSHFGKGSMSAFRSFVTDGINMPSPWGNLKGELLLGSETFREMIDPYLKGKAGISEIPVSQRLVGRPDLGALFPHKGRDGRDARIHEAVEKWGYSQKEVADFITLHYSSVSRILGRMTAATQTPVEAVKPQAKRPVPKAPSRVVEGGRGEKTKPRGDQLSLFS
jgi:putative transposase